MSDALSILLGFLLKTGLALVAVNEIRGFVLAAPVIYGIYEKGGTLMALWIGACSLAGIALSVLIPLLVARKLRRRLIARTVG